jgi:hypothetical protein
MSAFGPKRTLLVAAHMSAFRGKADMALCGGLFVFGRQSSSKDMPLRPMLSQLVMDQNFARGATFQSRAPRI